MAASGRIQSIMFFLFRAVVNLRIVVGGGHVRRGDVLDGVRLRADAARRHGAGRIARHWPVCESVTVSTRRRELFT